MELTDTQLNYFVNNRLKLAAGKTDRIPQASRSPD